MYKYRFTVFTPCYNSADKISRVYESLKFQTYRDFEWIIVDDGSTDDLASIIESMKRDDIFPIRLFAQETNKGKPSAINKGVSEAQGEFFLIIDADDGFVLDSLKTFADVYDSLPDEIKPRISSVTANCMDQHGEFIGTTYPTKGNDALLCDVFEMRYRYRVQGEKWGFTKTDIMKEFPFNVLSDKFVTENTVWFAIADKYLSAFVNKTLRVYYRFESDQCLSSIAQKKHPAGFAFYYCEIINKYMKKMRLGIPDKIRTYKNYLKYSMYANIGLIPTLSKLGDIKKRLMALLCIPLGYLAIIIDKRKKVRK